MNDRERQRVLDEYVSRLRRELADVPAEARQELIEDVRGHVEEAWAESPRKDQAALEAILARLGSPEQLAREERERLGVSRPPVPSGPSALAVLAVVFAVLFWPIGLILAWLSDRWRTRDKVIATVPPVLGLVVLLSVGVIASAGYAAQPAVSVQQVPPAPAAEAVTPSTSSQFAWQQLLGAELAAYGLVGAPLTAALYLGLRMGPRPRRPRTVLYWVASFVVVFAFVVSLSVPVTFSGSPTSAVPTTATQIEVIPSG